MQLTEEKNNLKDRAWIEINLSNLEHNIHQIRKIIPKHCQIMAVVKANAYGHQMIPVAKKLAKMNIQDFAVATVEEGILLRKNGIRGNILILGYTYPTSLWKVIKYDLIQTIVDYSYAKAIETMGLKKKMKAHIKINTGMNRLGQNYQEINKIEKIFQMKHLQIQGVFTHLASADAIDQESIVFTKKQIERFYKVIDQIKLLGYQPGKIHIQSSYGILNYSNLQCDYVRPGIIMYGVHSNKNLKTRIDLELKPVLSLRARITSIRRLEEGEGISYNQKFITTKPITIATVSIGYADGYPRSLSNKNASVIVQQKIARIIGQICMDQLIIDITEIENPQVGDIVCLIGEQKQITAEHIAYQAGTITNELLSRLGNRLSCVINN